ncbi:MAG: sugar ABC transporter permease [Bacteroidota bacterium]|nr:sugar ABC transporter permease [Bacteroidota bacterium]MDP4234120.1 sugar ABC transporter permease [Bacteroidota bacterium]MDP4243061.1 sugar ABC transporter permease [Bacteroidota bacterium]MDP4287487.1 sugar ABC transporter permease [Bacteroidota bacterium]
MRRSMKSLRATNNGMIGPSSQKPLRSSLTDRRKRSGSSIAYWYLAPILIGLMVFTIGPVIASLGLSLTHYEIGLAPKLIGLANYQSLLSSQLFWQVAEQTFYYALLYVPVSIGVSLALASLIEKKTRGIALFRTIYFLPVVTSTVAAAIIWSWLYNGDVGLLNYLLSLLGISGPQWLRDPHWAMPAIALMSVWKNAGYNMMILLAGLAQVPSDYHEAARLDGAGAFRRFRTITLPLLSPVLFFVLIVTTIGAFQVFEQTYVMTNGGPGTSTLTLSYYIWQTAFEFFDLGRAAALGYLFFLIVLVFTFLQFRARKRWVFRP